MERVAEVTAIAVSLFLSGTISGISMVTIPVSLSTSPSDQLLLQQWKATYLRGHIRGPAIATVAGIIHGGIAYLKWIRGEDPTLNALAAIFTFGIAPYTWTVMLRTNNELMNGANTGVGIENARTLVKRWKTMNSIRGVLPMIGGIVGLAGIAR